MPIIPPNWLFMVEAMPASRTTTDITLKIGRGFFIFSRAKRELNNIRPKIKNIKGYPRERNNPPINFFIMVWGKLLCPKMKGDDGTSDTMK